MSRSLSAAGAAVLIAGPTVLAFFSGGFFDDPRLMAAVVAWALVGLAALVARRPLPRTASGRCALGALALLAAWTALSLTWAPLGTRAEDDVQRILLYLGAFTAAVALFDQPWVRRGLEPLLALGALVVTGYGLVERLLPGLVELDRSRTSDGRLEQPVTYWNAEGAIAALGLVLAVRVAGDPRRPRAIRCVAAAGGVILALTTYLSFSRGALAAVGAGLLLLLALAPDGRAQARAVLVVAVGRRAGLVGGQRPGHHHLPCAWRRGRPGPGPPDARSAGRALRLRRPAGRSPPRGRARWPRRAQAARLARTPHRRRGAGSGRGSGARRRPARGHAEDGVPGERYRPVAARLGGLQPLPLLGGRDRHGGRRIRWPARAPVPSWWSGARSTTGSTRLRTPTPSIWRPRPSSAWSGLALLLVFFGGVVMCGVRLGRGDPAAVAGLAAGGLAWAVHAGLDWDWEMPAVTLPALLLARRRGGVERAARAGAATAE